MGIYSAIVTLVLTLVSVLTQVEGTQIAAKGNEADLELAKVSARLAKGIPATQKDHFTGETKNVRITGAHVDITLRNLGTAPALLSKATLVFRESRFLEVCDMVGGELTPTADYDIAIPSDQPFAEGSDDRHAVPFELSHELTHEIPANRFEKFRITVGPAELPFPLVLNTWFGIFDVILEQDQAEPIEIGRVAVGASNAVYFLRTDVPVDVPECIDRNRETVAGLLETPDIVVSRELEQVGLTRH